MNGKDFNDAMEFVGQDLIDLAEKQTFRRSPWRNVAAAAAALAVIVGAGAGILLRYAPAPGTPQLSQTGELSTEPVENPEIPAEPVEELPPEDESLSTEEEPAVDKTPLQEMFPMLAEDSTHFAHPETDWAEDIQFNYAGLDQEGSDLRTTQGDQVLALDMVNEIMLVRVKGDDYQGVLAICKDPTRLSLQPSEGIGEYGQTVGEIAEAHGGILAMTGSIFMDPNGEGSGGVLAGQAICDGVLYGDMDLPEGYSRMEMDGDGTMTLRRTTDAFLPQTQNAVSFSPGLLDDGKILVDENCGYTGIHPRAAIGQAFDGSVLMLVIEGRMPDRSMGTDAPTCAEILHHYDCRTAINLDGGTSALLWYDGEPVTKCSNFQLPEGRNLPTAFVLAPKP